MVLKTGLLVLLGLIALTLLCHFDTDSGPYRTRDLGPGEFHPDICIEYTFTVRPITVEFCIMRMFCVRYHYGMQFASTLPCKPT